MLLESEVIFLTVDSLVLLICVDSLEFSVSLSMRYKATIGDISFYFGMLPTSQKIGDVNAPEDG